MIKRLLTGILLIGMLPLTLVEATQYELGVDGLACPYCAYGIEKKLAASPGVIANSVEIRLNEGIVEFHADQDAVFTEESLRRLINDAGFTLRSVKIIGKDALSSNKPSR